MTGNCNIVIRGVFPETRKQGVVSTCRVGSHADLSRPTHGQKENVRYGGGSPNTSWVRRCVRGQGRPGAGGAADLETVSEA